VESIDGGYRFNRPAAFGHGQHRVQRRPQRYHCTCDHRCRFCRLRDTGTIAHAGQPLFVLFTAKKFTYLRISLILLRVSRYNIREPTPIFSTTGNQHSLHSLTTSSTFLEFHSDESARPHSIPTIKTVNSIAQRQFATDRSERNTHRGELG